MPLYEYACPAGHKYEALRSRDAEVDACACGQAASRLKVYRLGFSGFASTPSTQRDWRNDLRRYKEAADDLSYKKERYEDNSQTKGEAPRLYSAGKAKAQALAKAGVTADQIQT